MLQDWRCSDGAAQGQGEDQEEDQAPQVQVLSYHYMYPILSYHRYKEETVEELSEERAAVMPSFVMAETDRVTKVRCFYNSPSLCDVIYVSSFSFLIMMMPQSHCGRDTIHFFSLPAKDGCFD